MRKTKFAIIRLLIAGVVVLYQYFGAEKVINLETGKKVRVALSSQQEDALGLQSYREVLAQSEVIQTGSEHDMVVRVAQRLAQATAHAPSGCATSCPKQWRSSRSARRQNNSLKN